MTSYTIRELTDRVTRILQAHKTGRANAETVAAALVAAEIDGQKGHGLSRLKAYSAQAESGKVDGLADPEIVAETPAAIRIDARNGFAFPAMDLARNKICQMAKQSGVAVAAIFNSHHFGQAGYHVEKLAEQGLVAIVMGNSPQAMAPWGGNKGVFGTNPIAFAAPRATEPPLLIDLSLSKAARGKVILAAKEGRQIPEGWALDKQGNPTTDPNAALEGTMVPMGDAKGAALALMVEILAAAVTGANFGFEASSFLTPEGDPPQVGQFLLALNADPLSGGAFSDRLEVLTNAILAQDGTRMPGSGRIDKRKIANEQGIVLSKNVLQEIEMLEAKIS